MEALCRCCANTDFLKSVVDVYFLSYFLMYGTKKRMRRKLLSVVNTDSDHPIFLASNVKVFGMVRQLTRDTLKHFLGGGVYYEVCRIGQTRSKNRERGICSTFMKERGHRGSCRVNVCSAMLSPSSVVRSTAQHVDCAVYQPVSRVPSYLFQLWSLPDLFTPFCSHTLVFLHGLVIYSLYRAAFWFK